MAKKIEIRSSISLLDIGVPQEFTLRGLAWKYNTLSSDLGGFREKVLPGAFRHAVASRSDVKCLFNHSADKVLGRVQNGTLKLSDTHEGLAFVCQLDEDNSEHRNLYSSVKRGDIDACSWSFKLEDGDDDFAYGYDDDGKRCTIRSIRNVSNLFDCSIVTNPAYPTTSLQARSFVSALFPATKMTKSFEQQLIESTGYDYMLEKCRAIRFEAETKSMLGQQRRAREADAARERAADAARDKEKREREIRETVRSIFPWEFN